MTDYTRTQSDRLRALTVAGQVANLIRRMQVQPDLFQIATPFGVGGIQQCGLVFKLAASCASAIIEVTSLIAQTVTFKIAYVTHSACFGQVSITPSTMVFVAQQKIELYPLMQMTGCSQTAVATMRITATTDSGCVTTYTFTMSPCKCVDVGEGHIIEGMVGVTTSTNYCGNVQVSTETVPVPINFTYCDGDLCGYCDEFGCCPDSTTSPQPISVPCDNTTFSAAMHTIKARGGSGGTFVAVFSTWGVLIAPGDWLCDPFQECFATATICNG